MISDLFGNAFTDWHVNFFRKGLIEQYNQSAVTVGQAADDHLQAVQRVVQIEPPLGNNGMVGPDIQDPVFEHEQRTPRFPLLGPEKLMRQFGVLFVRIMSQAFKIMRESLLYQKQGFRGRNQFLGRVDLLRRFFLV